MGCHKEKKAKKPKPGRFRCEECGTVQNTKKKVCKPKTIKR